MVPVWLQSSLCSHSSSIGCCDRVGWRSGIIWVLAGKSINLFISSSSCPTGLSIRRHRIVGGLGGVVEALELSGRDMSHHEEWIMREVGDLVGKIEDRLFCDARLHNLTAFPACRHGLPHYASCVITCLLRRACSRPQPDTEDQSQICERR